MLYDRGTHEFILDLCQKKSSVEITTEISNTVQKQKRKIIASKGYQAHRDFNACNRISAATTY